MGCQLRSAIPNPNASMSGTGYETIAETQRRQWAAAGTRQASEYYSPILPILTPLWWVRSDKAVEHAESRKLGTTLRLKRAFPSTRYQWRLKLLLSYFTDSHAADSFFPLK